MKIVYLANIANRQSKTKIQNCLVSPELSMPSKKRSLIESEIKTNMGLDNPPPNRILATHNNANHKSNDV
jgi:hypothetical protein